MKLTSSGLTHVGMKRSHNEDCLRIFRDEGLFVVADGMGGHSSGEVASELSAETLARFYAHTALDEEVTWPSKEDYAATYQENRMRVGVQLSNRKIHDAAVYDIKLKGMGTTLVAAAFYEDRFSVGHVGDSRVYHYRAGTLRQVTEDHSLLNDYIKMRPGGMTAEEIKAFPHKNVIVRALGMKDSVVVDVITERALEGDLLILCSDGLSGMITDEELQQIIEEGVARDGGSTLTLNLDALCVSLINAANRNGGNDNVTALVVRCDALAGDALDVAPPRMQQPKGSPLWARAAEAPPAIQQ
ncbi:MAG: serine/threonine-protein phosphatase, partial [Deltaproteobacteria bacterium]|nr:serine/threonine-protein phosphatase [Deltaproteobacteria bacterium]